MQMAFKVFLITLQFLGILGMIAGIDKKREPITAGAAMFSMLFGMIIIYGLMIWL